MKLLTKDTDYAVRALMHLAVNKGKFISAKEISVSQKIPYQFLRSLLQKLIRNNLIESKEGVRGGVRIVKDPSRINVADLIRIFQGDIKLSECMFRKEVCPNRNTCILRPEIKRIENKVIEEFKGITIEKLLAKTAARIR